MRDEDTGIADTGGREKSNDHLKIETSKNLNEQKHIRRFVKKCTTHDRRKQLRPALPVVATCCPSSASCNRCHLMKPM
ncbi:MAG: hypothetical protein M3380_18770, partial [Chloroflexota bacterium]|nr:hypothetical protein [Chloroflexota bacterium]